MADVMSYVKIGVGSLFILVMLGLLVWVLWFFGKKAGVGRMFRNMGLRMRRKKLLANNDLLQYAVECHQKGYTEIDVRKEMLLANSYKKHQIEQTVYVFNIVKKELEQEEGGEQKNAVIKRT